MPLSRIASLFRPYRWRLAWLLVLLVSQAGLGVLARIFEVLDLPAEIADHAGAKQLEVQRGTVRLSGVSFRYQDTWTPRDIDLESTGGTTTALVGARGPARQPWP